MTAVLAEINTYSSMDGSINYFSLEYVTADGKRKVINKARLGGQAKPKGNAPSKMYNVKQKGVLVLFNEDAGRPETPKISKIIKYNGQRVWH